MMFYQAVTNLDINAALLFSITILGKQYYVFNSQYLEPGYPRPLTDLGLPDSIERIDAALVWSHNNRTYLYSGRLYWK